MRKIKTLLFLMSVAQIGLAQEKKIVGTVYGPDSQPMSGVTVSVKGKNKQASTNKEGKYNIVVGSGQDTLVFSSVGFIRTEKPVAIGNNIIVTLQEDARGLDEVVVIGYGTVSRKDLAGAVSSIKGKELEKAPVVNVAEALTGRLPGVQVTTVDGAPGAEIVIRVRGGGSITQDNAPLYIVD